MHEPVHTETRVDTERLREWLTAQRWYASKTRAVSAVEVIEQLPSGVDDGLLITLVQARFATGTHELYQLILGGSADGPSGFDALSDPPTARALLALIESGEDMAAPDGRFSFRLVGDPTSDLPAVTVRPMGVEQSNSSVVFANQLVLKVFRKVDAGINPELEILRFLTATGYPNIAPLHGWYEYEGNALAGTLGVVQEFLPDATDGWQLGLDEIASGPEAFLDRLGELGAATARLHTALASNASDPAFSPEEPSNEAISLLTATIDEDIEQMFLRLPADDERLAPIIGRGEDVRERLAARAHIGIGGKQIRIHGDYHLGQTLHTPRGWVILDFEGEPARPLSERRMKRSPLKDVAGMLRSFAYVTSAATMFRDRPAPDDFEARARVRFLERYFEEVDPTLLPAGDQSVANLLAIFELEKAIYELRYELDNRPEWVSIPVSGIERLLETA